MEFAFKGCSAVGDVADCPERGGNGPPLLGGQNIRCMHRGVRQKIAPAALPEMEAPHLGVSSGGVEVDGGFAKVAGNSRQKA